MYRFSYFSDKTIICAGCGTGLSNAWLFGLHLGANTACVRAEAASILRHEKPKKHRVRRTIDFKCEIILELEKLELRGIPHAQTVLLKLHTGITRSDISRWQLARESLFDAQLAGRNQKRYLQKKTRVWHDKEEDELYVRFISRREIQGLKFTDSQLVETMRDILEEYKSPEWINFKCSPGWLSGFKKRYKITCQQRNNKKHLPLIERVPLIRSFHLWLLHTLQRSAPQTCLRSALSILACICGVLLFC